MVVTWVTPPFVPKALESWAESVFLFLGWLWTTVGEMTFGVKESHPMMEDEGTDQKGSNIVMEKVDRRGNKEMK